MKQVHVKCNILTVCLITDLEIKFMCPISKDFQIKDYLAFENIFDLYRKFVLEDYSNNSQL